MVEFYQNRLDKKIFIKLFCDYRQIDQSIIIDTFFDSICLMLEKMDYYNHLSTEERKKILYVITRNKLNDYVKGLSIEKNYNRTILSLLYDNETQDDYERWFQDIYEVLLEILDDLSTEELEIINWHYFDELRFKEIAAIKRKTEKAIQKQHERLINKIRSLLPPPANNMPINNKKYNVAFLLIIVFSIRNNDYFKLKFIRKERKKTPEAVLCSLVEFCFLRLG